MTTTATSPRGCYDCDATIAAGEPHYAGVPINHVNAYLCPPCHAKRFPAYALVASDQTPAADVREAGLIVDKHGTIVKDRYGAVETVNHPAHYQSGGIEAIDVIEAFELGFNLGNAAKYILRAGRKGDALEDLKKAHWYLHREIARRGAGR